MRKQSILWMLGLFGWVLAAPLVGCSLDQPEAPKLPVDDSMVRTARPVVALGNSLTAGFQNGGLAITGQLASIPNLLSMLAEPQPIPLDPNLPLYMQMPLVGTGNPLEQQKGIGSEPGKTGLFVDGATLQITRDDLPPDFMDWLLNSTYPLAYDDLGVPGATTQDVFTAVDAATSQSGDNSFFDLILRNSALPPFDATPLDQLESHFTKETIVGLDPTTQAPIYAINVPRIVIVWIGNNDILGGALSGNPVVGVNVTPASVWEGMYTSVLDRVASFAQDAQIVLANLQTSLPYFEFIPLGTDVPGVGFVPWTTDEANVKFILLTAASDLAGFPGADYLPGGTSSIPGEYTITEDEWTALIGELDAYNTIIAREATARGWALADVNAMMLALPSDPTDPATYAQLNRVFPWLDMTGDQIPEQNANSAFTLDGIHPSEKGYAAMANLFAQALNDTYGTSYGQITVDTVVNQAGFEQVLGAGAKPARPVGGVMGVSFTRSGAAGLRATAELLAAGR